MAKKRSKQLLAGNNQLTGHNGQTNPLASLEFFHDGLRDNGKAMVEVGQDLSLILKIRQLLDLAGQIVITDQAQHMVQLFIEMLADIQKILDEVKDEPFAGYMEEFVHMVIRDTAFDMNKNRQLLARKIIETLDKPLDQAIPSEPVGIFARFIKAITG